jgi:hypothetical protein
MVFQTVISYTAEAESIFCRALQRLGKALDTRKNREDLCFARRKDCRFDKAQDFMVHTFTRRTLLKTTAVGLGIADLIGTGYEFAQPIDIKLRPIRVANPSPQAKAVQC